MMKHVLGLALFLAMSPLARALEVQGILTHDCQRHMGLLVYVSDDSVEMMNLQGQLEILPRTSIDTIYVFNVIENPIQSFHIDSTALRRLKAVYLDNSKEPRVLAFPVRYIEDLIIFYSVDGHSHVHTFADIYKLRPPPAGAAKTYAPTSYKATHFAMEDQSAQCDAEVAPVDAVKPTRVLADKITISEFLHSFQQGYENLESFQERTYLYAKPFLFDKSSRLGIDFEGKREEAGLNVPVYFQWSTGEPYRFQSQTSFGGKRQEITPNAEPVFSVRSDVKSHIFHAIFLGNLAGISAGSSIFLDKSDLFKLDGDIDVQPSFNYMAMMGGDVGPYSLSVGFFYPTYGIKVGNEYREILGSSVSYALRMMYTLPHFRLRAIGSWTSYDNSHPTQDDVLSRSGESGNLENPKTFKFNSLFVRGGVDYDFSDQISAGVDGILVNGNYEDTADDHSSGTPNYVGNNIRFNRLTIQPYLRQSFSNYVSITGYVDFLQNNYKAHFDGKDFSRQSPETKFFGTFEFIF